MTQNGFFKTFDGTRLYYSAEGSGPPLLFCYGLVCSKLHWSYQMEYFKKNHTIIWFDYRGHHRSDPPRRDEDLSIANIAHDIECLLDELKIPQAVLLGHSMGVNLALEAYRRAPQRVKALVLANGTARGPLATMFRFNLLQLLFPYLYSTYKKYPKIMNLFWSTQGKSKVVPWLIGQLGFNPNLAKESDIRLYVQMIADMDAIITLQLLKDYENYDATSWLHDIHVPTLIIAGEKDLIIPKEEQELMHQLIAHSKFELIRNGSHCPQMDIPELVNVMIERFLAEAEIRPETNQSLESGSASITSEAHRSLQGDASYP